MMKPALKVFMLVCLVFLTACGAVNPPTTIPIIDIGAATAEHETQVAAIVTDAFATLLAGTPSETPTPTLTPTLEATPTLENLKMSVSTDTNCRQGPGQVYDYLGGLQVGETAEPLARDPSGLYYYILNPDGSGYCWVWGRYATFNRETNFLPVYTPPATPTPTPDFSLAFEAIEGCVDLNMVELAVTNTGMVTWESYSMTMHNDTHGQSQTNSDNQFADTHACGAIITGQRIEPGQTQLISNTPFMHFIPSGDTFTATVKMCSLDNLAGVCLTKTFSFVVP